MHKIKQVSALFRWLFQITFLAFPILFIMVWVTGPSAFCLSQANVMFSFIPCTIPIMPPLNFNTKILGFLVSLLPLVTDEFILYFLIKLFQLYERAEIFTLKNVQYIRNIGYMLLVGQLIDPIYQALISLVMTWHNPPGHKIISIAFSGVNVAVILTGFLVILVSWIMAEGCKIREDQQYTI